MPILLDSQGRRWESTQRSSHAWTFRHQSIELKADWHDGVGCWYFRAICAGSAGSDIARCATSYQRDLAIAARDAITLLPADFFKEEPNMLMNTIDMMAQARARAQAVAQPIFQITGLVDHSPPQATLRMAIDSSSPQALVIKGEGGPLRIVDEDGSVSEFTEHRAVTKMLAKMNMLTNELKAYGALQLQNHKMEEVIGNQRCDIIDMKRIIAEQEIELRRTKRK